MTPACVGYDPDWWFSPEGSPGDLLAARLCDTCPVAAACYDGALERGETSGRWGGKVFPLPQLELLDAGPVAQTWHGTAAGYKAHSCKCGPCLEAHRLDVAQWRLRRAPMGGAVPTGSATSGGRVGGCSQIALFDLV